MQQRPFSNKRPLLQLRSGRVAGRVAGLLSGFLLGLLLGLVATIASAAPQPVAICDDETFLRRIALDTVGRQPTPAEIDSFLADPSANKRADAIDGFLADPDWARTWARYFRDVILYRRSDDRAIFMAQPLEAMLSDRLAKGVSWAAIAREFITATGVPAEHGETAIIMAQMGETADIAAEVSRVFLGIQIQCAQCHDHFTDHWKRKEFHAFAAFFPRIEIQRSSGMGAERFEVVSYDAAPRRSKKMSDNPRRGDLEHAMPDLEDPSEPGQVMKPQFFINNKKLPLGIKDAERRRAVAGWITTADNPWFSRAIINRIWTELVGAGFYEGIDDIGPDRTPQSPHMLDDLSQQFIASNYDMRSLFRAILSTQIYQRESRSRSSPQRAGFAANCPQRLRSDQLFKQILSAIGVDEAQIRKDSSAQTAATPATAAKNKKSGKQQINVPRVLFTQVFGYDPSLPREEIVGSIPQALLLMNSQPLSVAFDGDRQSTTLGRLLHNEEDDRTVVKDLYLRALARHPTPGEQAACLEHVHATGDREEAFEDVFWALLNSAEFVHRK